MLQDLIVRQGTNVMLDESPPQGISEALQRIKINKLQDLVDVGFVRSRDALDKLLDAAKKATAAAIQIRSSSTPLPRVHGTMLPDLQRFSTFRAATLDVPSADAEILWRTVRGIEPANLEKMTPDVALPAHLQQTIYRYQFKDVVVQSDSVLTLGSATDIFECDNLKIYKNGEIVVQGSGMLIKAFSIEGNI